MQCVVRTYESIKNDLRYGLGSLIDKLEAGWKVILVNPIGDGRRESLEYILVKDDE